MIELVSFAPLLCVEKFRWRERPPRKARHANSALEVVQLIDSHSDRGASRTLRRKVNRCRTIRNAVDVTSKFLAVVNRRYVMPLSEFVQVRAIEQRLLDRA